MAKANIKAAASEIFAAKAAPASYIHETARSLRAVSLFMAALNVERGNFAEAALTINELLRETEETDPRLFDTVAAARRVQVLLQCRRDRGLRWAA